MCAIESIMILGCDSINSPRHGRLTARRISQHHVNLVGTSCNKISSCWYDSKYYAFKTVGLPVERAPIDNGAHVHRASVRSVKVRIARLPLVDCLSYTVETHLVGFQRNNISTVDIYRVVVHILYHHRCITAQLIVYGYDAVGKCRFI